jgi:hypothetical protein
VSFGIWCSVYVVCVVYAEEEVKTERENDREKEREKKTNRTQGR